MNPIHITPSNEISPCYQCEERKLHCHSDCERYKDFKNRIETDKKKEQAKQTIEDYVVKGKIRIQERIRKRGR